MSSGVSRRIREKIQEIPELVGSTYASLMGCVIDSAGVQPTLLALEAPTGGSGRRRHRGPVGELNLHGTCAPL